MSRCLLSITLISLSACVGCGGGGDAQPHKSNPDAADPQRSEFKTPSIKSVTTGNNAKTLPEFARPKIKKTGGKQPAESRNLKPQIVFRPSDNRPKHDIARLRKFGIHRYESKRLRLYTDIEPKVAKTLPAIIDAAYVAWENYFGKLPPNRERTAFQTTGYLIKDKALFARAGLVPGDLPSFVNGRHRGYEFWMYEPPWTYYRRHLLIHEATHCFMYAIRDRRFATWYMEGMAEFFGTHVIDSSDRFQFGVMPNDVKQFVGSGRIEYVQIECKAGSPLSIAGVVGLRPVEFIKNQPYAWSWALCKFLDSHPRYGKRFRELGRIYDPTAFRTAFANFVSANSPQILSEWHLFVMGLDYGYDAKRAAMVIRPGQPLAMGKPKKFSISAEGGWQSSGVHVTKGETIEISAVGRFELAQQPKPWISEPQGITFTYFQGRPLGELHAVLVPDSKESLPIDPSLKVLPHTPIGTRRRLKAEITGTIYLRLNDHFGQLADNRGKVAVSIQRARLPAGK